MPLTADAADTQLKISSEGAGERWERLFNGVVFTTRQWRGEDGLQVERFGEWELHFKLRVDEGNIFMTSLVRSFVWARCVFRCLALVPLTWSQKKCSAVQTGKRPVKHV